MKYWTDTPRGQEVLGGLFARTPDKWRRRAYRATIQVGKKNDQFTADQVAEHMGEAPSRRLGPIMLALARRKVIAPVARTTFDRVREVSHGAPVTIWCLSR